MQAFVAWLASLPPSTVYLIIAVATFIENIVPPIPSDVLVALGGFLIQQAGLTPVPLWFAGWSGNFAGTVVVYFVTRKYGRRLVASRLGQRFLPADAIVGMEREYLRFGMAGIFLARFLPGFRSFVAPFSGLVNLPPWRALLPIGLASAIWYALLTWAGIALGEEWSAINHFIKTLNRSLAVIAVVIAVLVVVMLIRRSRARPRRKDLLLRAVHRALGDRLPEGGEAAPGDVAGQGAAALLFELTRADDAIPAADRAAIADFLRSAWGLGVEPPAPAEAAVPQATQEMAAIVTGQYDRERRLALACRLYKVALSDGRLSQHEERLMRRAALLLGLAPEDLAEARRRVGC